MDDCMVKIVRPGRSARAVGGWCLALGLVAFAGSSWAATPIYKCLDKNLSLVYTDVPCKDGEQLDIRSGDADSAAVERLERERDALDQSAYQRAADERRTLVGDPVATAPYAAGDQSEWYDHAPAYGADYGIYSYWLMHYNPMRPRKTKAQHMRHFAPRPPYIVPRH